MKTTMVHTQPGPEPLGPKKTLIVMVSLIWLQGIMEDWGKIFLIQ